MNPEWFGDSYDIVKRFFCEALRSQGYATYIEPLPTGSWNGTEEQFYRLLGVEHVRCHLPDQRPSALFIDPDIGIAERASKNHTTLSRIVQELLKHQIVWVFDQSFSRSADPHEQMLAKLIQLRSMGGYGCYYDSHAKFLFVGHSQQEVGAVAENFFSYGLPRSRMLFPNGT